MLNLIDEHSRGCPMALWERRWSSAKLIKALADVMVMKGVPTTGRSSQLAICASGWPTQARRRYTSSLALRGRTVTAGPSTRGSATSS